jgi:nitroreductase
MDTWNALTARRNVRTFSDEAIDPDVLDRILEAGRRAPSSRNLQRWDLIVVTDHEQLGRLAGVWQGAGHVARSAATIAIVAPVSEDAHERESIEYDLGQLTTYLMVAAADAGVGTGHAAVADQRLAQELLGFPDGYRCAWLIALGHPADRPLRPIVEPERRPFDDVVHRGRW